MRIILYFLLCLTFASSCTPSEKNTVTSTSLPAGAPAAPDTVFSNPTTVEEIKKTYANINQQLEKGLLDSISHKYDCNGERNGTITYFSYKGKLVLVNHSYNEYSHFAAIDQYFVSNNTLFFAYFKRTSWSFDSAQKAEGATKDNITEQRLYIAGEKPLLCLEKKYTIRSHAAENPVSENVQNKERSCETLEPVKKDFERLVEFQGAGSDCLEIKNLRSH